MAKLHFAVADLFAVWIPSLLVHVLTNPVPSEYWICVDEYIVSDQVSETCETIMTGMTMELLEAEIFDYYHESHGALQCDLLNSANICIR